MSEGIQEDYNEDQPLPSVQPIEETLENTDTGISESSRGDLPPPVVEDDREAAAPVAAVPPPRAGALLFVEIYDKLLGSNNNNNNSAPIPSFSTQSQSQTAANTTTTRHAPNQILQAYIKFLVKRITTATTTTETTEKDSFALCEALTLALGYPHKKQEQQSPLTWDPIFLKKIVDIVQDHASALELKGKGGASEILERVKALQKERQVLDTINDSMDPNQGASNDPMASLVSGIAGRMSLGEDASSSSSNGGIAHILSELGPSCTRSPALFRDVLADVARTTGSLTEASLARLIFFFSAQHEGAASQQQDASNSSAASNAGLSSALLGSLLLGRGQQDAPGAGSSLRWNLDTVAQVLSEDYANSRDWVLVARSWDFASFKIQDANQFRALMELYRAGAKTTPPLSVFTSPWRNAAGQLTFFEALLMIPPSVFMIPLDDEESADAATAPPQLPPSAPNPRVWASMDILHRMLYLSEIPSLYRRVRDMFVRCLLSCPEVLLCSLVRLQLRAANAQREAGGDPTPGAGVQLKTELMRELIPLFFRSNPHHRVQNGPAALRRLYAISPTTVMAACYEAWRSTLQEMPQNRLAAIIHIINIARLLPSPQDAVASLLSGSRDPEYSIAVAFVMADNEYLQMKPWLGEKLSSKNSVAPFAVCLVSYLRKNYTTASSLRGHGGPESAPLVSYENMVISLQLLQSLDPNVLAQPVNPGPVERSVMVGATLSENVRNLVDVCLATHPSLRSMGALVQQQKGAPSTASDEVEEMATAYFQKIYTSEQSIGEVVEMLKRFKTSGDAKENEIFACMVHNLFDEYRFFAKYPEKELRITGILFGALIQEQLVSSITLGIALRYVLEALRKAPAQPGVHSSSSSGKMFRFGMFALEQFKGRLHEWPQYCSHIVQIPHLKERYADLVAEIEHEMTKNPNRAAAAAAAASQVSGSSSVQQARAIASDSTTSSLGTDPATRDAASAAQEIVRDVSTVSTDSATVAAQNVTPRVAEFGPKLGRAVTEDSEEDQEFQAPGDQVLDRVQFLVNNLAPSNVEQKANELKGMLDPTYFDWLGHFLVVKRISTQANFHALYLSFLDNLGDYGKGLVEAILRSVYHHIGKLLRSPKITTSSSERSYLKNLGIWLGQITLSRNRPILQIMLDCKELLLQGYETGKLIAVAPFLAKTLEGAKNSVVFRPPNPWLMGLLGVFRAVYDVEGLKMNIKFEVEVLCKNLSIKLEDIPLRNDVLSKRIAPVKERNPDFNIKTSAAAQKPSPAPATSRSPGPDAQALSGPGQVASSGASESSGRTTPVGEQQSQPKQETMIPNLGSYVIVKPNLLQLIQSQGGSLVALTPAVLKRCVPVAVDRAIREIIQPVVERSVTISCITTQQIVTKDFAMEGDEGKMRKAGQLMVANLAGSLALVTCREPLRSSISTNLRQLLTNTMGRPDGLGEQEQNVIEQCVQICATDNLELGCRLIEKAATEKAIRDVEDALADAMTARRKHREQTGQHYYDMSMFSTGNQQYPAALPDRLRPKPGGLRPEHFQLYESFQRISRQNQPLGSSVAAAPGGIGAQRSGTPSSQTPSEDGVLSAVTTKQSGGQQFSTDVLASIVSKLDAAVTSLLAAAGTRGGEIKLAMLPSDHQIRQSFVAVKQLMPNSDPNGAVSRPMSTSEQELVLAFSQSIFKRLYDLSPTEILRLEALVAVLECINVYCPKLGKDMGTWATYAPSSTDAQRRLHKTILLLLIRGRLLSVHDLDAFLSARADQGRNHIWVEFSLFFIRSAFIEKISSPSDFPKLMDLMSRIADGRSQATAQVVQAYRKAILVMFDESRMPLSSRDTQLRALGPTVGSQATDAPLNESSSLSAVSLTNMSSAPSKVAASNDLFAKNDPANARQQVTALLDGWIRVQTDSSGSEKVVGQYLQVLQQFSIGKVEEHTERFLRLSTLIVVEAVLKSAPSGGENQKPALDYTFVDIYSKLLQVLFRFMNSGGQQDQVDRQRLNALNKILGVIVRAMMWHSEKSKRENPTAGWDQRPWFRLLLNLVIDLNKPDPALESIRLAMLSVFGSALHVCQPLVLPGFAFAWLELVAHRHFLPNLMLYPMQKAWPIANNLLVDLFLFLEPFLRRLELSPAIKKMYEGTLRVLLVLLHDFPSFLAGYHHSLCNVIPENCVQLRNIILSATPKEMSPPDPFTPNLKIDLLPEIRKSPPMLANVIGPIEGLQGVLEAYLKDGQRRNILPLLYKEGTSEVDSCKINSLVVYVGVHAIARLQMPQMNLSHSPETELVMKLMELDDSGRYTCLNAIANQLRFPSSHTHYFSCLMLFLFSETKSVAVKEQITRVLLERLIVNRPHPWGLLITFIELIKNQRYAFWTYPFTRCATEIEKVFESVARSCMPLQERTQQRSALVGGGDDQ